MMMNELGDGPFLLVFDAEEMKPGCALLQAMGGTLGIASEFDPSVWLTAPTPNMKVYELTREFFGELVGMVHELHLKKRKDRVPAG